MAKFKADAFDVALGKRMRALRTERGLSLEQVADVLGITYQQVQKYETGANRTAPSKLARLARLFKVPVGTFFGEA